jgi:hypothetical protein
VPDARWQHTAINTGTEYVPGRMIVFGGQTSGGTPVNDTWELDLATMHWEELAVGPTKPSARRGHTALKDPQWPDKMLVFGGQGAGGFVNDLWRFDTDPGEFAWHQLSPNGGPPGSRAWHSAVQVTAYTRVYIIGGRGMDTFQGETQWALNLGGVEWVAIWPTLPPWWGGGRAKSDGRPEVTLQIEDAAPNQAVNLLSDPELEPHFVVQIFTTSEAYKDDIDVAIQLAEAKFDKDSVRAGTRIDNLPDEPAWSTPQYLGSGVFVFNDVDLVAVEGGYAIQVVFMANVIGGASGVAPITARARGSTWEAPIQSTAMARFYADPEAWIVTNRTNLPTFYSTPDKVRALLQNVYEKAFRVGAVVLYPDRYLDALAEWDNTAVDYTDEESANEAADALATWLSSRYSVRYPDFARAYPRYIALIGDDDVVPFYRQQDVSAIPESASPVGVDPVVGELVSHNYYFTDNPYGDAQYAAGSLDWETGELEAAVGRVVGHDAADMSKMVTNSALGPETDAVRALIASATQVDWSLDGVDITEVIPGDLGYTVNPALIDDDPDKSDLVSEMALGIAAMALGGTGTQATLRVAEPWVGGDQVLEANELDDWDVNGSLSFNRIFYQFQASRSGCSTNYGVGWFGSWANALAHIEASGGIAPSGLACCSSPQDEASAMERLSADVWVQAQLDDTRTNPLGWSLMMAKKEYASTDGAWDSIDTKTVQEFTYFGLPWMRLDAVVGGGQKAPPPADNAGWSVSRVEGTEGTYTMVTTLDASNYTLTETPEGFDLIEVVGMDQAFGIDRPVLPVATLDLMLPLSATVTNLALTPSDAVDLPGLDIPTYALVPGPEAITATYATAAGGPYPAQATYTSDLLDSHQLVQVQVLPAAYDTGTDLATLYRDLEVAVTYVSDQRLAMTYFEPDKIQFVPGEPVAAVSRVVNAGDATETAMATLVLQDLSGEVVGYQASDPFEVPAGGYHDLDIELTGPLDGDTYALRVLFWQSGQVVTGAGRRIAITAGEMSDLTVPQELAPGEQATFTVTYANLGASAAIASVSLVVYDEYGVPVGWPEPQTVSVAGGSNVELTFAWTPVKGGTYLASAVAMAGRQEYGPLTESVSVRYSIYMPLGMRSY